MIQIRKIRRAKRHSHIPQRRCTSNVAPSYNARIEMYMRPSQPWTEISRLCWRKWRRKIWWHLRFLGRMTLSWGTTWTSMATTIIVRGIVRMIAKYRRRILRAWYNKVTWETSWHVDSKTAVLEGTDGRRLIENNRSRQWRIKGP